MGEIEDKVYAGGAILLMVAELFLAIPLMTDSMVKDGSTIIAFVAMGHFFWWLFGKTGMVENPLTLPHLLGVAGLFVSLLPIIGFVWHGLVAFLLMKYVIKLSRHRNNMGM